MNRLVLWGWVLFVTSVLIIWASVWFCPINVKHLDAAGALLLAISFVCFILSITIWAIVRAIEDSRKK